MRLGWSENNRCSFRFQSSLANSVNVWTAVLNSICLWLNWFEHKIHLTRALTRFLRWITCGEICESYLSHFHHINFHKIQMKTCNFYSSALTTHSSFNCTYFFFLQTERDWKKSTRFLFFYPLAFQRLSSVCLYFFFLLFLSDNIKHSQYVCIIFSFYLMILFSSFP